jgi:diguanylate cyclase (GGDEF)-like protein
MAARQAPSAPLALVLIDIDFFKPFNDRAGHLEGDRCLKEVARALAGCARRSGEFLARYGGEEFVALLPGVGLDGALTFAAACAEALEQRRLVHPASPVSQYVTVSIGVSSNEGSWILDSSDLIRAADHALYEAKSQGRNRAIADGATGFPGAVGLEPAVER